MYKLTKETLSYYSTASMIAIYVMGMSLLLLDMLPFQPLGGWILIIVMIVFPFIGLIYAFFINRMWVRVTIIILNTAIGLFTVPLGLMAIIFNFFVGFD